MSSSLSPRACATQQARAGRPLPERPPIGNPGFVAGLDTVTPSGPSSGVLPCLLLALLLTLRLALAVTAACLTGIPLRPRRGALAH
ncbi:hypothetical protein ACIBK1_36190 [Microbispora rosea]|uniref:hypothetical protein n=1 Tax=Microbispora rosea TaxID=58117 RepID=UPI00379E214F